MGFDWTKGVLTGILMVSGVILSIYLTVGLFKLGNYLANNNGEIGLAIFIFSTALFLVGFIIGGANLD